MSPCDASFPPDAQLARLTKLQTLSLAHNKLAALPPSVGDLAAGETIVHNVHNVHDVHSPRPTHTVHPATASRDTPLQRRDAPPDAPPTVSTSCVCTTGERLSR